MTRNIAAIALIAVTSLVTVTGVSAQERTVQATIPFEFMVGQQILPPGTYKMTATNSHQLLIASNGRGPSVLVMANAGDTASGEQAKLFFNRIGEQYSLTKIVSTSPSTSVVLVAPKSAKRAMQIAALQNDGRTVIAMK